MDKKIMADVIEPLDIDGARRDLADTKAALNEKRMIVPREGDAFESLPLAIQKVIETGLFQPFSTEAELKANVPIIVPTAAKALDTKKVWIYEQRVGESVATWHDTGLSELDQAISYTDKMASLKNSFYKILDLVDANNIPVLSILKDKSVWIPNLKKDIASSINMLNDIFNYIYFEDRTDLLNIKDVNNIPFFRISKNLEVDIGRYRLKNFSDAITILKNIASISNGSDLIRFVDLNNLPILRLLKNQDLLIPKVGNLTQTVLELKKRAEKETVQPSSGGSEGADLILATLVNKESSATLSALKASTVNALNIFPHAVNLIRIPAITRIQKNKYLCFFEARVDGDDFGRNSQGVCTLTVDVNNLTVSASNIQVLHAAEVHATVANAYYTFMNACAVKIDSGRIITLYVKRYGTGEHYIYKRYSDDDGATWSTYEDIGTQLNMSFYNLLCPCSQGLVKRYGSFQGRIMFPVWYSGRAYKVENFRAGYIYSDDDGATWKDGDFNKETLSNEVQCAEDINGDILFCIRRETTGDESKTWSKLIDGEFNLTPFKSKQIINKTCIMSGLIQSRNQYDLSVPKFQYIGTYSIGRKDLKIYSSYDGGVNWVNEYDVPNTENGAVYSCIERLDEYYAFALWEKTSVAEFSCQILSLNTLLQSGN